MAGRHAARDLGVSAAAAEASVSGRPVIQVPPRGSDRARRIVAMARRGDPLAMQDPRKRAEEGMRAREAARQAARIARIRGMHDPLPPHTISAVTGRPASAKQATADAAAAAAAAAAPPGAGAGSGAAAAPKGGRRRRRNTKKITRRRRRQHTRRGRR